MIAEASGAAEGAALVVPPPPAAALVDGDGEAVVPQAAASTIVSPMAPSGERGRCIRPPPQMSVGSARRPIGRAVLTAPGGSSVTQASSRPADGGSPHPLSRAGRARVGRASSAGPRRWTLNSKVSATYDS